MRSVALALILFELVAVACTPKQQAQIVETGPPALSLLECTLAHVPACLRSGQAWPVCALEAATACQTDEASIWRIWAAHVRAIYQDPGGAALRATPAIDAGAP